MTKLEQVTAIATAGKAINAATQSLTLACNTLLELQKAIAEPNLKIVDKEK